MPPEDDQLSPAADSASKSAALPVKPRIWPLFVGMLIELVLVIVLQVGVVFALLLSKREPGKPIQELTASLPHEMLKPGIFTLTIFLSGFSMILCGLLFGWLSARNRHESLARRLGVLWPQLSAATWIGLLFGSVAVLLASVGAVILLEKIIPSDKSVLQFYENLTNEWAIVFIIVIGVMPGVGEELFFRGFVQRRMLQRFRPAVAIGFTSALFGLFHVTPHGIALATIIGVWLGVIAWRANSIWPSACCHAFINSGWNVYQVGRFHWGIPEIPPVWVLVPGGLIVALAFVWSIHNLIGMTPVPEPLRSSQYHR